MDCDTREGIILYLQDGLSGLHTLLRDRNSRNKNTDSTRLSEWVIFGKVFLYSYGGAALIRDFSGNVMRMDECGQVLSTEKFMQFGQLQKGKDFGYSIRCERFPTENLICPECGKGWDISNIEDYYHSKDEAEIDPGREFLGKTIKEFASHISKRNDAIYRLTYEILILNPKYIDHNPHPVYKNGFANKPLDYVLEIGDKVLFEKLVYRHIHCHRRHQAIQSKIFFEDIFRKSGFEKFSVRETKNEYCTCIECSPWYEFAIPNFGIIKLGWRKHVINIDWFGTGKNFISLFESENVTKWEHGIHAWGKEKAIEYLSKIRNDS